MTERQPYTYVLLRYRHDPLAGEFANVGVVLHAPESRFLKTRTRGGMGPRLAKIFPAMDRAAFRAGLLTIGRSVGKLAGGDGGDLLSGLGDAGAYARRALPSDDSSFVWGPLGSGLTDDPARTLDTLYARFVSRFDAPAKASHRNDAAVWKPVHDLLLARRIADRLQPQTITSPVDEVEFDHAWKNGAWHVYQPLSFDMASDDLIREKAARWAGHLLGLEQAEVEVKPHFIVAAPRNGQLRETYKRALDFLRLSGDSIDIEIVDVAQAPRLVDEIEAELRAHDAAMAD